MPTRTLTTYGVSFAVESDSEFLLHRIEPHLPPCSSPAPVSRSHRVYSLGADPGPAAGSPTYSLRVDDEEVCQRVDLEALLAQFESHVQLHVAEMSPEYVFVHAGVVAWRDGAIVLPGPTYSGKSRLVAELVRQGADYYSDEYAVLDRHGLVHAYPRLISLRRPSERGVIRERLAYAAPAGGYRALPVRAAFLCRFRAGSAWQVSRMPPGEAAIAIVSHVVSARREPGRTLACLSRLVATSPVYTAVRGEAADAATRILSVG